MANNTAINVIYVGNKAIDWQPNLGEGHSATDDAFLPARHKEQAIGGGGGGGGSDSISPLTASPTRQGTFPSTDQDMRVKFVEFLKRQLCEADDDDDDDENAALKAMEKKCLWASLAMMDDPTSRPRPLLFHGDRSGILGVSLDEFFLDAQGSLSHSFIKIEKAWTSDGKLHNTDNNESRGESDTSLVTTPTSNKRKEPLSETTKRSIRPSMDIYAQRTVPAWYGHRCALSGVILPDAAHIVPVRVTKGGDLTSIRNILRCFWPLEEWEQQVTTAVENILPMCPTAHRLWDRYKFALRPIADMEDPQHKIYVQMVWLAAGKREGAEMEAMNARGKSTTSNPLDSGGNSNYNSSEPWDHDFLGSFADFRRGADANGRYAPVRHGDVYQITTTDPDAWPLPNLRLLQIQFGAQKIMAGIRGAAALRDIFRGNPPADDNAPPVRAADVPPEWRSLVDAAVEAGVLDDPAADRWIAALTRNALREQRRWLGEPDEEWEEHWDAGDSAGRAV